MDGYRCSSWCDSSFSSIVTLKKARCLDVKGLINRRCRQLPLSVTSSKLVPERDTSWMRDALMGSKDCSREEEIREWWEIVTVPQMQYMETYSLGKVICCWWLPKNMGKVVTNCNTKQLAEFLEEPNLSSPIKVIGAQQSGLIAQ